MSASRLCYGITLVGYFSLLSLVLLWNTVISPSSTVPVAFMLVIATVPLLLPLRGLLYGRPSSTLLTAILSLLYFVHGVTAATSNTGERVWASLEIVFSLLLFFGAALYLLKLEN